MSFLLRLQRVSRLTSITYSHHHHPSLLYRNNLYRNFADKPKPTKSKSSKSKSNIETNTNIETATATTTQLENAAVASTVDAAAAVTADSTKSDQWRMRWYKLRRLLMYFGIPFGISTGLFALHDSDIPYVYCFKKLQKYPMPDDYDPSLYQFGTDNPPPNPAPTWAQTLPFLWAQWAHSQRPGRIMKQWNNFMPLLDKKYPTETRMVAIGCLLSMLTGGPETQPPFVHYDKCMRKLEILKGYKSSGEDGGWTTEKFLNTIYSLCGEVGNQQLMFTGLQLLLDLTSIPNAARKEDIDYIMKVGQIANMREDLAESLLEIYQDPVYIIDFCKRNPPRPQQKAFKPDFIEIKRILIRNGAMKFAFQLLDAKSLQLQQMAMFLLIGLVGKYPDIRELKANLGETEDEKIQNGIKLVDSLARMGQEHFMRGENEAALGAFKEALKFFQTSAQLRYFTGKCLSELGRIEEAKTEYRLAMALTPNKQSGGPMPEATLQLCNLLIKHAKSSQDILDAIEYLEMLIDSGSYIYQTVEAIDIADIYDRLVLSLEKLGKYDDALDRLLALCKIKPNAHQVHFECGRMAILCHEYDLAREHLEYSCKLEPFDMFSKYHYALSLFHLSEFDESKKQIFIILQSKPNDEKCLNLLARIHINNANWDQALQIYQQIDEKQSGNDAYIKYQIGVANENLNHFDDAIQSFNDCTDLWYKKIKQIGYNSYFYNRPKEARAYQKISSRCERHQKNDQNNQNWNELNEKIFQIGMM